MQQTTIDSKREKFQALRADGQSVRQASILVGVAASTGYAWARARGAKPVGEGLAHKSGVGFARLVRQSEVRALIELEVAGVVIRVPATFDADSLAHLINVIRRSV